MHGNPLLFSLFGISVCFLAGTVAREAIITTRIERSRIFNEIVASVEIQNRHICTGGVIGNQFVLTAAFCLLNRTRQLRSRHISVLARTNNLYRFDPPAIRIHVQTVFVPRNFDPQNRTLRLGDIAVLRLFHPLRGLAIIQIPPLLLPLNTSPEAERRLTTAGFGWSTNNANDNYWFTAADGRLRVATVREISEEQCEIAFPHGAVQPNQHYCAKLVGRAAEPESLCTGDTGAPLMTSGRNAFRYVYAILSKFPEDCNGQRQPAIYTRVYPYSQSIRNVMQQGHDANMISLHAN